MIRYEIDVINADIQPVRFQRVAGDMVVVGRSTLYRAVQRAVKKITTPPARFSGKQPFKDEAMQAKVMALVRAKLIDIPYQRSGRYRSGYKIVRTRSGYEVYVGAVDEFGFDYSALVGGGPYGEPQARIHRGRWAPALKTFRAETDKLPGDIPEALHVAARRLGF